MTLEELLQNITGSRLEVGSRWLVWADAGRKWEVYNHVPYHRHSDEMYQGEDLSEAIKILTAEE